MSITPTVKAILANYESDNPGTKGNIARMLMQGRLGGTGKMVILPVDQGFEHGPARSFATTMLARFGVQTEFFDPHIGAAIASLLRANTRIVYLESPGSYTFEIQDVPAICKVARAHGALTMIDNAWASPVFARPFDWGIDISLLPLTKYWGGHADLAAVR